MTTLTAPLRAATSYRPAPSILERVMLSVSRHLEAAAMRHMQHRAIVTASAVTTSVDAHEENQRTQAALRVMGILAP